VFRKKPNFSSTTRQQQLNCVTQFSARAFFTTASGQGTVRAVPAWTRPH